MDLQLKRTKYKVTIYDKVFELRRPTVEEYQRFTKEVSAGLTEGTALDKMTDVLVSCGIPKEELLKMEMEDLNELFTFVMGSKKK